MATKSIFCKNWRLLEKCVRTRRGCRGGGGGNLPVGRQFLQYLTNRASIFFWRDVAWSVQSSVDMRHLGSLLLVIVPPSPSPFWFQQVRRGLQRGVERRNTPVPAGVWDVCIRPAVHLEFFPARAVPAMLESVCVCVHVSLCVCLFCVFMYLCAPVQSICLQTIIIPIIFHRTKKWWFKLVGLASFFEEPLSKISILHVREDVIFCIIIFFL